MFGVYRVQGRNKGLPYMSVDFRFRAHRVTGFAGFGGPLWVLASIGSVLGDF